MYDFITQTNIFFLSEENNYLYFSTAWDKFISPKNGATIPIGWILPEKPSSAAWQKCLNKETF